MMLQCILFFFFPHKNLLHEKTALHAILNRVDKQMNFKTIALFFENLAGRVYVCFFLML